uniref:ankyrin repeat domain-containing protein 26 isoform X2 n=1 Tax=Jaculus jaculus TaxID=51337 RepID=UPI001E1B487B|nr:ankyrin repeat domain-containing protein 26 isoform X2 [Jaculus jaculus]
MRKIFGSRSKGPSPLAPGRLRSNCVGFGREGAASSPQPRYPVQDKDLGKIHKAACAGDVAKVQHALILGKSGVNDRDKKDRTALHFACAFGHPEVVTLLVERKCEIDAYDSESRTPLMKAIQCQEEECATILLEHGASPDVTDASGNTALHYAVYSDNASIAAKLLAHSANLEAKNKDDLTALLLAVKENKHHIMDFLVKRRTKTYVADKLGSNRQLRFDCEEQALKNSEDSNSVDKSSEDGSLSRLSNTPGPGDPWPTSDEDDYNFDTKNVPKVNLTELWTAAQQSRKNQSKHGFGKLENRMVFNNSNSNSENEDADEVLPETSVRAPSFSVPSFQPLDPTEETTEPAVRKEENGANIESASREQPNNGSVTNADETHKNNKSEMMSALGLGEDEESPWDSESVSESPPLNCVGHVSLTADHKGESIVNGQVEDVGYIPSCMSGSRNLAKLEDSRNVGIPVAHMETLEKYPDKECSNEMKHSVLTKAVGMKDVQTCRSEPDIEMSSEEQRRLSGSDSSQLQVEANQYKGSDVELSENLHAGAPAAGATDEGLSEEGGKTDGQQFPVKEKEEHERPTRKTSNKNNKIKNKVRKQTCAVEDSDDLTQSSETASEDCELPYPNYESILLLIEQLRTECKDIVSLLKVRDAVHSYRRLIEVTKSHCELLRGKIKRMGCKVSEVQKELSETKEAKSQLEHEKVEWEQELSSLRFALKQEGEKRRSADQLYDKIMEQFRKKEEQYNKEVEVKQQLEISLRALDMELKTVKDNLNQVVEERNETQRQLSREQNARLLQDGILANHLCKQQEIETAQRRMTSEVSVSHEKEKDLLHKNYKLQDEIAMLRLEIDTIKNHNQEKEKKYLEDIESANEKNENLQRAMKLKEETFTKTVFQYNRQFSVLTAENALLSSKLENEKQNKERLETEIESYRSRLASAVHDHGESQTSKRDLEIAFQRAKDEWCRLQDKMNFDISNLKDNNEVLSQQLSKTERKFNSLEIEFHHARDALREKTLVLKHVQRDLSQAQCQMKEVEHLYQNEQGKVNKYIGKQESIEERLSLLHSENTLLRQQLDEAHSKVDRKDKTVVNIQDQFRDLMKKLQAEREKQNLMLEDRNKELINECNHLKERVHQYENEKTEREVVVRELQQELADTLKKQSMSEASLEITSHHRINLEEETRDLKKKLSQLGSQLQEARDQHAEAVRCTEKTQDQLHKVELENSKLKTTVKKQAGKIEQLQKSLLSINLSEDDKEQLKRLTELKQSLECNLGEEQKKNEELEKELTGFKKLLKTAEKKLNEYESRELSFRQDIKTSQLEMDIPINVLINKVDDLTAKLETTSSKYLHLDKRNQLLQQELLSMKTVQKKCEKLEKNKKKLEQEVVNLKSHIEENMIEYGQVEHYKREVEERAKQDLVEKLKQVNLFLQTQATSQESLEQLRENNNASIRNQMELRIKDLESELAKMKAQEDFHKFELEKYKQLHVEEFRIRKSLSSKLNKCSGSWKKA